MGAETAVTPQQLRERLASESFLDQARANAPGGMRVRTQEELDRSLEAILREHAPREDIHVFCYGSLMWNPGLEHSAALLARVHGWHRRFCLRNLIGRGTPETPGLMLALDRGGSCNGVLLRIPAGTMHRELTVLWRREMAWGSYQARWVNAWIPGGPVRAVTFVVDRRNDRYLRDLSGSEAARLINTGCGSLGTCRAYFDATLRKLRDMGIRDRGLEQLWRVIDAPSPNPALTA